MATLLDLLVLLFTALQDVPGLVAQIAGWSRDEAREYLRRVWGLARLAVLTPFVLLLGGALAGGIEEWGPLAKTVLVYTGLGFAAVMALMLAWRAIPLTAILAAIIEASRSGPARLYTPAETAAKWYVTLIGAILANELWIGMVVWLAPIHNKPEFILPVIILSLILTAYWLWKGGLEWYPKVIYGSTLILLLALIAAFWFPNTAAKMQAFEPEQWLEQRQEQKRLEEAKRRREAAAQRVAEPQATVMEDGTVKLPPGAIFELGDKTGEKFLFQSAGVFVVDGRAKIEAPAPVTLPWSREVTREFEIDAESHARQYGGPPCFYGENPFRYTISAPHGNVILRGRIPGEKCS